ncbi:HRDC domain-containing protein [Pseudobutyrivibrio sp. MD2005]|uniref:HRDC domain-containing protein n=1 Tax=Pseudobutyrivibrio sp. MD2005 TaxID=1410616 RepID=UPI000482F220|nr:HRDC domain-containing protein [Pseudobutyrivibrio sp. MD2005]
METYEYNGEKYYFKKGKWIKSDYTIAPISVVTELNKLLMENENFDEKSVDEIIKLLDGAKMTSNTGFALKLAEEAMEKASLSEARALLPRMTSLYRIKHRPEKAIEVGEHYIGIYEGKIWSPSLFTSLAAAYCDLNELEKARKYANRARAISGNNSSIELMSVYSRLKKLEEESPNIVRRDKVVEKIIESTEPSTSLNDIEMESVEQHFTQTNEMDDKSLFNKESENTVIYEEKEEIKPQVVEKTLKKKKTYDDWVEEYPDRVVIRKEGFFYTVKDECATVIASILRYNIGEYYGRYITGSPSLEIMTNELKNHHISYVAIVSDEIVDEEVFTDNQFYAWVSEKERLVSLERIRERKKRNITKLGKDGIEDILNFIDVLNQGTDPITGEIYDEEHFLNTPEMKVILEIAKKRLQSKISIEERKASEDDLNQDEHLIFCKLKGCRMDIAREYGVPPYTICHDSTLAELSKVRPKDIDEMLLVPGVGEKAIEKYGEAFLKIINEAE